MDALSYILRPIRLSGAVFLEGDFSAPWCLLSEVTPEDYQGFITMPVRVIAYHYVVSGTLVLSIAGLPPVTIRAGEIVLLPHNDPHVMGSSAGLEPENPEGLISHASDQDIARIQYGGGGEITKILCGFLGSENSQTPLLGHLPPILHLTPNDTILGDWLGQSFRMAARELAQGRAGSASLLARISEMLFIEAIRTYFAALPEGGSGWLSGLRDPVIGKTLSLMHDRHRDDWTTDMLASAVGMSRSAFAQRFRDLIGQPPMRYLTQIRLEKAAESLRHNSHSLARIAFDVGYDSEAAFQRAFKREYGVPPATWRRENTPSR
ncbi:AraC family transcriptional regulator [Thalassospira sp.]|uniref:AraC family transcriptional regulator n=1 Tax=Thalassospira sp. TaxID=1912094 RepID=UPI00273265FC|nr:AraC family transcriptional regulator [Thalassospira sp.]MDP2699360.1 AraC family transcriptional regulator [Thalassospira sp.]